MATRTEKAYLLRRVETGSEFLSLDDMSTYKTCAGDYILIGTGEAVIEMKTDEEQIKGAVVVLEAAKKRALADCEVKINQIDAQIQSLLAITHEA